MNLSISFFKQSSRVPMAENKHKKQTPFPDGRLFNWKESNEIMNFVTRYMEYKQWLSPITFKKLEWEIKTRLPYTAKTHHDVMAWLDLNFKR